MCILLPWAPIARPTKSDGIVNSSQNGLVIVIYRIRNVTVRANSTVGIYISVKEREYSEREDNPSLLLWKREDNPALW